MSANISHQIDLAKVHEVQIGGQSHSVKPGSMSEHSHEGGTWLEWTVGGGVDRMFAPSHAIEAWRVR